MDHPHHPLDTRLPALLKSGRPLRGLFNSLPSPAIVEMCGYAGFDFVILDNETRQRQPGEHRAHAARRTRERHHSRGALPAPRHLARARHGREAACRFPWSAAPKKRAILCNRCAIRAWGVAAARSARRAAGYGAFPGVPHTERSNAGVALIVMIETPEAVEQAAEMAAVPGVDAVFVGPNDLSHAMGFDNNWKAPRGGRPPSSARCARFATRAIAAA